ncbi:MAG: extracellular solute-binding protein [Candidatus Nanopelagicales bacterium]
MNRVLFNSRADRLRRHSIPWAAGATAIAYDSAVLPLGLEGGFPELLSNRQLRGKVGIFASMIDSLPSLACGFGTDATEMAPVAVERTIKAVAEAAQAGQFALAYDSLDYTQSLVDGRVVAGLAYSGDILKLRESLPTIRFAVPRRGAELWVDSLVVPTGSPHRSNAERLMAFYYEPQNAADLAASLKYMCPVPEAQVAMAEDHPELAASPLIFPTSADLAALSILRLIRSDESAQWTQAWNVALTGVPR